MRAILFLLLLNACNQWVRPQPEQGTARDPHQQHLAAVTVISSCTGEYESRAASGVMVSDWQVLTALHAVDCQSNIARIRIENANGERWNALPEEEWRTADVARIQLSSADRMSPSVGYVAIGAKPSFDDMLFMHSAYPFHTEQIGTASGWTYYGPKTGGDSGWFAYRVFSEPGNSGSGIYDNDGRLVGIHLGPWGNEKYGAFVTSKMVPGN